MQPTLAIPFLVTGILHPRFKDVEALLHREGFITSHPFRPATPAHLHSLLHAMGHASHPAATPLEAASALVIPLAGRRCVSKGGPLPLPSAGALQASARALAGALLGALAPQHPACLLAPATERAARASASLLAELMAPLPPPRLPVCATLRHAHAARASSRTGSSSSSSSPSPSPSPRSPQGAASLRSSSSSAPGAAPRGGACLVTLEEVLGFVFPPRALHPRSMARLVLYALQGPLRGGALVGGRLALARALTDREVEAELDALEEEDVLAAYTGGSVLGGSVEPVLRSVRADGAAHMPSMSLEQVEGLLAPVVAATAAEAAAAGEGGAAAAATALYPRGALLSFHGLQAAVLQARALRVRDLRCAFPPAILAQEAPSRLLPAPPVLGRNALAPQLHGSTGPLASLVGATRRGPATSAECWEKQSDIARARKVEMLLHTRLQQVAPIWGTNTSIECGAVISNTQLMRDYKHRGDREWLRESVFTQQPGRGTYCPSTRDVSMSLPLKRMERL